MTVLRQSKCQYCQVKLETWWDKFLNTRMMGWIWSGRIANYVYLRVSLWWSRKFSKRWHNRFHTDYRRWGGYDGYWPEQKRREKAEWEAAREAEGLVKCQCCGSYCEPDASGNPVPHIYFVAPGDGERCPERCSQQSLGDILRSDDDALD